MGSYVGHQSNGITTLEGRISLSYTLYTMFNTEALRFRTFKVAVNKQKLSRKPLIIKPFPD